MHAIIESSDVRAFAKVLSDAKKASDRWTTIPILGCAMLATRPFYVVVRATDMELHLEAQVAASGAEGEAVCVNIEALAGLVSNAPQGLPVELATVEDKLRVTIGAMSAELATMPTDDFPDIGSPKAGARFTMAAPDLHDMLATVRHAISTKETRPYLNGVFLHVAERDGAKVLRTVAVDGHRLAMVEKALPAGAEDMRDQGGQPGVIVPVATVATLMARLAKERGAVEIGVSENGAQIVFRVGDAVYTSKTIDGTFPDYERVIPRDNGNVLRVSSAPLAATIKQLAATFTASRTYTRAVKFTMDGPDSLDLAVSEPRTGTTTAHMNGAGVMHAGDALEIGFLPHYVADILAQVGPEAEARFSDACSPATWHNPADASRLFVLMPIRV